MWVWWPVTTDFYMVEDFLSFFMPLCARSISSMKPYHAVLHIVFVFSTSHIYFYPDTRFISSFIWGSFIYDFYLCVYIYMNVIFVCIFYSVTGHHGRTVWLNGPPCINILKKKKKMWVITGSRNGLSLIRYQAISRTNADLFSIKLWPKWR